MVLRDARTECYVKGVYFFHEDGRQTQGNTNGVKKVISSRPSIAVAVGLATYVSVTAAALKSRLCVF